MFIEFGPPVKTGQCTIKLTPDKPEDPSVTEILSSVKNALGHLADDYKIIENDSKISESVLCIIATNEDLASKMSIYKTAMLTIKALFPKSLLLHKNETSRVALCNKVFLSPFCGNNFRRCLV